MKILLYCASEALQDEIRESLARLAPVDEVSSAAGEISAAAAAVDRSRPDLLVLGGFDQHRALLGVVERLTGHDPKLAVIVVGRDLGSDFLIEAMRAGVREIVPHPAAHTALLEATDRIRRRMTGAPAGRARGKVLAVVSSKGGSGATFEMPPRSERAQSATSGESPIAACSAAWSAPSRLRPRSAPARSLPAGARN